jgi:hypothetical protein
VVHSFDVWEHLLRSLQHAANKGWPLEVRLAALFHDVANREQREKESIKLLLSTAMRLLAQKWLRKSD